MSQVAAWVGAVTAVLWLLTVVSGHRKFAASSRGSRWLIGMGPLAFVVYNGALAVQATLEDHRFLAALGIFGALNALSAFVCYVWFLRHDQRSGDAPGR